MFSLFQGGVRRNWCASLWSRIFNFRVLISETQFELARDWFGLRPASLRRGSHLSLIGENPPRRLQKLAHRADVDIAFLVKREVSPRKGAVDQLMSERGILCFKPALRLEW